MKTPIAALYGIAFLISPAFCACNDPLEATIPAVINLYPETPQQLTNDLIISQIRAIFSDYQEGSLSKNDTIKNLYKIGKNSTLSQEEAGEIAEYLHYLDATNKGIALLRLHNL